MTTNGKVWFNPCPSCFNLCFLSPMPLNYPFMKLAYYLSLFLLLSLSVNAQVAPISDDFSSNNRGWPIDDEKKISNGVYEIMAPEDGSQATINFFVDLKADFEVGIDLTQRGGSDQSIFGLAWNSGFENYTTP